MLTCVFLQQGVLHLSCAATRCRTPIPYFALKNILVLKNADSRFLMICEISDKVSYTSYASRGFYSRALPCTRLF